MLSPSFIRRYTPPTCTLKIKAKQSLLSSWAGYPVLKDLKFELDFDDPRLPETERVTIQGDRLDLECLCDAVTSYVTKFLQPTKAPLPLKVENDSNLVVLTPNSETLKSKNQGSNPIIKPKGLLYHELSFDAANSDTNGYIIKLSATQLFDLANALDEYSAEVAAIPNLKSSQKRQVSPWLTAAAGLIVGVGITTTWVKFFNNNQLQQQIAQEKSELSTTPQQLPSLEVIPPTPPTPTKPTPLPTLAPSLSSSQPLSPPSPVPTNSGVPANPILPSQSITITPPGNTVVSQPPLPAPPMNTTGGIPPTSQTPLPTAPPQIPNLPPLQRPVNESPKVETNQSPTTIAANPMERKTTSESGENRNNVVTRNSKPTIPQVTEIENYFQQKWSPPSNLTENLEYSLQLNADGSLQRIIPIGKASATYLDQTNMPLLGQPFVSPVKDETNPKIHLTLGADGSVSSFLED